METNSGSEQQILQDRQEDLTPAFHPPARWEVTYFHFVLNNTQKLNSCSSLCPPGSVITGLSVLCNSELFIMKLMLSIGIRSGLTPPGNTFSIFVGSGLTKKARCKHGDCKWSKTSLFYSFIWQQLLLSEILMEKDGKYQQKVLNLLQDTRIY